jgi:hypothetical protein
MNISQFQIKFPCRGNASHTHTLRILTEYEHYQLSVIHRAKTKLSLCSRETCGFEIKNGDDI